ncbi:hypothetical protein FA13DRAFT_1053087 [Coprinellus micaceus]|uniref:Uncharacterized protein n=1 Tax=Coprinellus micaceus TaxID=71717 RepID=A0A4Y7SWU7_COPMI|nr:hypothetical protein FA13DRAFT_1053087 [Coprinellus micaceus]
MDLTSHMFLECEPAGRAVIRNMAADTELLLVASFLLVVQAYYDPAFTAEDMDTAMDSRYAGFLQPSAWLNSIEYFLALDDEETDLAGVRDDRLGTLTDIVSDIEEFKALIEAKIWQCGPISTGVEEPPAVVHESFAGGGDDDGGVASPLSPRVHPLLHHYRSPSTPSLGVADDGHNVHYAPSEQDVHVLDEQVLSQTPASSSSHPEFQTLSSSIPLNASPRAGPRDRSNTDETIAHLPSSSAPFSVPHPSVTPGSLAALLASDPNDWTSQYAEITKMVDNVNAVIHQTSHLEAVSDSESHTESGPESAAAQERQEPPADSAFIATSFPSTHSFASSLGYIEISASSTPTPPWSIQVPSWDERVPQHHSYPQTVGGMSLDVLQPLSLPRTGTDSSTLVEDASSFAMKAKGSFATTTTSTTGSYTDWLASWRRNPTPSILSETTVDSEDSESSGWLADGSANSHCIPRRAVPVSRLIMSPMSTHHDFPSTLAHHFSQVASIPSESKLLTFLRRLKLPGYRSRQGKRTAALNISEPCVNGNR